MSFRKDRYAKRTLREQKRANRIAITFGVLTILTAGIGLALGQRHAVSQNGTEDQPPSNGSDGDLAFTISPWVDREGLFGQKRLVSSKELKDAIETSPSGLEELCYAAGGGEAELMSREVRLEATGNATLRIDQISVHQTPTAKSIGTGFIYECQAEGEIPSIYASAALCGDPEALFETALGEDKFQTEPLVLTVQPSELVRLKMVVSHGMTTGVKVVATVRNSAKETPREVELWSTPGIVVDEPVTVSSADGQVAFYASGKVLVMFMSEARKLDMSHANIMTLIDAEGSQREGLTRRDGSLYWVKGPTEDYCS